MLYSQDLKKRGGSTINVESMDAFAQCLSTCGLSDMGYYGYPFTWTNGREGRDSVQERLDRALANKDCLDLWPHSEVRNLHSHVSDHAPILIKLMAVQDNDTRKKPISFRFDEHLSREPELEPLLRDAWMSTDDNLEVRLELAKELVTQFGLEKGSLRKQISHLEKDLERAQKWPPTRENIEDRKAIYGRGAGYPYGKK